MYSIEVTVFYYLSGHPTSLHIDTDTTHKKTTFVVYYEKKKT